MTGAKLLFFVLFLIALVEVMQADPNTEVPAEGGAVNQKAETEAVVKDGLKPEASNPGETGAVVKDGVKAEPSNPGGTEAAVKDEVKAKAIGGGQTEIVVKDKSKAKASNAGETRAAVKHESKADAIKAGPQSQITSTPGQTQTKTTDLIDLLTYKDSVESVENGGYPYAHPRGGSPGFKHVKAHDGFHDIRNEVIWAHWNDAFTTTLQPLQVT